MGAAAETFVRRNILSCRCNPSPSPAGAYIPLLPLGHGLGHGGTPPYCTYTTRACPPIPPPYRHLPTISPPSPCIGTWGEGGPSVGTAAETLLGEHTLMQMSPLPQPSRRVHTPAALGTRAGTRGDITTPHLHHMHMHILMHMPTTSPPSPHHLPAISPPSLRHLPAISRPSPHHLPPSEVVLPVFLW